MFETYEDDSAKYEALLEHYGKILHPNHFQVKLFSYFTIFIEM